MNRPFNIIGYDLKSDRFQCRCDSCGEEYEVDMNLLPHDVLGLCKDCEREVFMLEDILRKSNASTAN